MKGVILAGGLGTRLNPITIVSNKHLLPVYNKPMIYYPIECLVNAQIHEILLITGGNNAGDFLRLLGNGEEFGLKQIHYAYQKGEGGIADALKLAEFFADGEKICVILGDNIIEKNIVSAAQDFEKQASGAMIMLKEAENQERFGVPTFKNNRIIKIEEKPKKPKSNFAVTGIYFYDNQVFDITSTLKPSSRGELEITDVNNEYLRRNELEYRIIDGWWTDAGTFDSLLKASSLVSKTGANKLS